MKRKRRSFTHVMEDQSLKILADYLPKSWVVRNYKPDYGIDISVEIFEAIDESGEMYETSGEFFFAQVKSIKNVEIEEVEKYPRFNVERRHQIDRTREAVRVPVIKFSLDVLIDQHRNCNGSRESGSLICVRYVDVRNLFCLPK